jgi:folate-binding protein YgfZ
VNISYTSLESQGALLIEGPDSDTFLQGQTTCDLGELSADHSIAGAYCNPQGRMVCEFRLVQVAAESRLLAMHGDICESSAAVFGKYIVFSKAEISIASTAWQQYALWGDDAADLFDSGPGALDRCWQAHGAHWVQLDEAGQRLRAWVPTENSAELVGWLRSNAEELAERDWQLAEINAGQGHLEAETIEMFIPQMLNYQRTGQVSFTKGCYTGQEVVARMHYRGKLKRPMYLASVSTDRQPLAGEALFKPGSQQSIGNVVNAAPDAGGYRLLAVIATDAIEAGIHLGSESGPQLMLHELPYSISEE